VEKSQKFSTGVFHSPVDKSLILWKKLCVGLGIMRCHFIPYAPRWRNSAPFM